MTVQHIPLLRSTSPSFSSYSTLNVNPCVEPFKGTLKRDLTLYLDSRTAQEPERDLAQRGLDQQAPPRIEGSFKGSIKGSIKACFRGSLGSWRVCRVFLG